MDHFDHISTISWRFEAIIQTRANLSKAAEPVITMNLKIQNDSKNIEFEAEPGLIESLTDELEQALKLMKGKEARRLQKYL